jgi:Zn-dependent peptidase ImmA (M78 family)
VDDRTSRRQRRAKVYPVQVRLDAYERERLEEIAAAWGVTLSAALRRLIREATIDARYRG